MCRYVSAACISCMYQLYPLTAECHLILKLLTLHKPERKSSVFLPCRHTAAPLICCISTFLQNIPLRDWAGLNVLSAIMHINESTEKKEVSVEVTHAVCARLSANKPTGSLIQLLCALFTDQETIWQHSLQTLHFKSQPTVVHDRADDGE